MQARSVRALPRAATVLTILLAFGAPADAQRKERPGREVVDSACAECHTSGKDGAPRIGDARAWSARASQGLSALTAHALAGLRKMPAHGGTSGVSDLEIQRAIAYMVNRSGGNWVEPVDTAPRAGNRPPEAIVSAACVNCHQEGKDGAPRIGDRAAWTPRMAKGLDQLVAHALHGHGPMPARGGMTDLSAEEVRAAVLYMFNHGLPPAPPEPYVARADPYHKVVGGTDVYFGLLRADAVKDPNAPAGRGYYHLNIALADNRSQAPVKDALVTLKVSDGMLTESKALRPVSANNAVSWGEYFRFASGGAYNIVAEIRRPGVPGTIEARFEFRAP